MTALSGRERDPPERTILFFILQVKQDLLRLSLGFWPPGSHRGSSSGGANFGLVDPPELGGSV